MPEEPTAGGNQKETAEARLETRLNRLEQEVLKENRWWRGGLIAALVLVALAILIAGHHRRPAADDHGPDGYGWMVRFCGDALRWLRPTVRPRTWIWLGSKAVGRPAQRVGCT